MRSLKRQHSNCTATYPTDVHIHTEIFLRRLYRCRTLVPNPMSTPLVGKDFHHFKSRICSVAAAAKMEKVGKLIFFVDMLCNYASYIK